MWLFVSTAAATVYDDVEREGHREGHREGKN